MPLHMCKSVVFHTKLFSAFETCRIWNDCLGGEKLVEVKWCDAPQFFSCRMKMRNGKKSFGPKKSPSLWGLFMSRRNEMGRGRSTDWKQPSFHPTHNSFWIHKFEPFFENNYAKLLLWDVANVTYKFWDLQVFVYLHV